MTDPSPLTQTVVYMTGIILGYTLLTEPEEWRRAWQAIREVLGKKP